MADTASFETKMAAAGKTASSIGTSMEASGRKSALITSGLTAAGLAVAAFGVASVKMAADFDQQMSTVQANSGATSAELSQLRQAALDAGASTVYTAAESAGAINDLAKAGMSVSDILSGGLTASLNLAAAGQMDVGDAAEYTSQALTMFHLKGSDATSTADALAAGADKAVGNVSDFGEALNNCGVMANSFGMSMQETVGILGLFAQNGIVGAEAGTQLNSMLMRLSAPSSEAKATMDELGISTHDASGKFVGMSNLAGQLHDKLGKLTDQQRQQAEATMFGSYAIKGAGIIMDAGSSGVDKWTKAVSESGFAAKQASAKTNNLKGDLTMLSSAMGSLMTNIGEGAQGPLRSMTKGMTTLVTAFSGLPAGVQQTMVLMGGLTGVLLAVHKAASGLHSSTSGAANSIGLMVDPVQRVKAALSSAKTAFEMFRASGMSASEQMAAFGTTASKAELKTAGFKAIGSSVMSLLGGPWGIALTVAGAALSAFISRQQKAKEATEQLQSALESGSDISSTIADSYQKMNFAGASMTHWMSEAKVSLTDMTSAAMGNKTAADKVNAALKEYGRQGHSQLAVSQKMRDSIKDEAKAYAEAKEQAGQKAKASKNAVDADGKSASAAKQAANANKELGNSASDASSQIDDLVKSLFGLESGNLTADQAVDQLNQKIGELTDTCKDNGIVFNANGDLLDRFSEKGTKTRQALEDIASSAQNAAEKILKQGESTNYSNGETDRASQVLQDARDAIIKQAEASGMSEQAANRLADRWGLSSDSIKANIQSIKSAADGSKAKLDVDDSKAKGKTKSTKQELDRFGKAIAKARLEADDKASGKARNARKYFDAFHRTYSAKLDAKDDASPKVAKANAKKLTDKRNTLHSTDRATPKVDSANAKTLRDKRNALNSTDKATPKVDSLNRKKIGDKRFNASVIDNATFTLRAIDAFKIADKTFTVTEKSKKEGGYTGGMFTDGRFQSFAAGGMFTGYVDPAWAPGNSLSDSVYLLNARLAAGEYTHRASAVDYYGLDIMRAINDRRIPREQLLAAGDTGRQVMVNVDTASVVAAIASLHNDLGAIIGAASGGTMSDRDLGRLIRRYARA
uniref:Minor tail protein n=1 Tax=Siphoviridae sp. ctB9E3 TaxID=2826187 RepID=A0A8S5QPR0_9CAUD|nr:MAG TPA: minor tail protein [Siphoviridae sp. ctB9E3]